MNSKSNSFHQVTPFVPRSGLLGGSYVAFPLDIIKIGPDTPPIPGPPEPDAPIFEQYDGPFVGIRYLTQSISGQIRTIYSFSFLGVNHSHSAGMLPLTGSTSGLSWTVWSGSSTYDPITATYASTLSVTANQAGAIPTGQGYYAPSAQPVTYTSDTIDGLFTQLNGIAGITLPSRSYIEGPRADGTFIRRWFSETPGPFVGGYFAGYFMARIWSDGWTTTIVLSNLVTPAQLGIPIARTGIPAKCQHVLTYDPDTFTYTGTKSRVRQNVPIPSGRTKLYGDFVYFVTPDNGDAPYFYYDSKEYDVTPSTTYNAVTDFPWITGAQLCFISSSYSFTPSYYLGYSIEGELTELPASSAWPESVSYCCPAPNSSAWDDFQDYGGADPSTLASPFIISVSTGYGWVEDGGFFGRDLTTAYDDFESYPPGIAAQMTLGVGWQEIGGFYLKPPWDAVDDFQSYVAGPATTMDSPGFFWVEPGGWL